LIFFGRSYLLKTGTLQVFHLSPLDYSFKYPAHL
jgi:hypothetical protein